MDHREGVAVHDFWKPYYRFDGRHALCNAHLLRDLTDLYEVTGEAWVDKLQSLLAAMLDTTNQARAADHSQVDPGRMASADRSSGIWPKTCYADSKPIGPKF